MPTAVEVVSSTEQGCIDSSVAKSSSAHDVVEYVVPNLTPKELLDAIPYVERPSLRFSAD